jgi:hypothetical protein
MDNLRWELERDGGETNESLSRRVAMIAARSIADLFANPPSLSLLVCQSASGPPSAVRDHRRFWGSSAAPTNVRGTRLAERYLGDPTDGRWAGALQVLPADTAEALRFLFSTTDALALLSTTGPASEDEATNVLGAAFDTAAHRGVNWSGAVRASAASKMLTGRAFGAFDDRSFAIEFFEAPPAWWAKHDMTPRRTR